jgi:hypothetical protein
VPSSRSPGRTGGNEDDDAGRCAAGELLFFLGIFFTLVAVNLVAILNHGIV